MFGTASTHAVQLTNRPSIAHPNVVIWFFFHRNYPFTFVFPTNWNCFSKMPLFMRIKSWPSCERSQFYAFLCCLFCFCFFYFLISVKIFHSLAISFTCLFFHRFFFDLDEKENHKFYIFYLNFVFTHIIFARVHQFYSHFEVQNLNRTISILNIRSIAVMLSKWFTKRDLD